MRLVITEDGGMETAFSYTEQIRLYDESVLQPKVINSKATFSYERLVKLNGR